MKTKKCFGCDGTGQRHGQKCYLCGGTGKLRKKGNKSFNLVNKEQSVILKLVKNLLLIILLLSTSSKSNAQTSIFFGASGHILNNTIESNTYSNLFGGCQFDSLTAIMVSYYGRAIVSTDLLIYKNYVISRGIDLSNGSQCFLTVLYTNGWRIDKKWKFFIKMGVDYSGNSSHLSYKKVSTVFGFGFRN